MTSQSASILSNDGVIDFNNSESPITYYAKYILQDNDIEGEINFEIIVTDSVGIESNPVTEATDNSSVIFDHTSPVLSDLHIESNNSNNTSIGISGDEIFLTFSSNELLIIDSVSINIAGQGVSFVNSENTFSSSYILNGNEPPGFISYNINYQD